MVAAQNRTERSSSRRIQRARKRLLAICANCWRQRDRENRTLCSVCAQKQAATVKAYCARLKRAAFEAYGGCKCACCLEVAFEFLSIDHMDNSGAVHRKELRHGVGDYGVEEREPTFGLSETAIHRDFECSAELQGVPAFKSSLKLTVSCHRKSRTTAARLCVGFASFRPFSSKLLRIHAGSR
jgi:hypothetical protein